MNVRLAYGKIIDRQVFYEKGGNLHPKLDNIVLLQAEPGIAGAFLIFRGWADDHGSFTEQFKIKEPEGRTIYTSSPREVHIVSATHTERLEDEVADLEFEFAGEGYLLILYADGREIATINFDVKVE
ncbi:MAG TPA: hypothetical protein VE174_05070 [Actinomycetota bacterium]|nr:hypothetical protein [Actinomycetota bacterium]